MALKRFIYSLAWALTSVLVLVAALSVFLRVALPNLNAFQKPIINWVQANSGLTVEVQAIHGSWKNTYPSLSLVSSSAFLNEQPDVTFDAKRVDVQIDIWASLKARDLVVSNLVLDGLNLDLSKFKAQGDSELEHSELMSRIDNLFLTQLGHFTLRNSELTYTSVDGKVYQLDIERLNWRNQQTSHFIDGEVSLRNQPLNSLQVAAHLINTESFADVSGEVYVSALDVQILPWLPQTLREHANIKQGSVSANVWIEVQSNKPQEAFIEVLPSELSWQVDQSQELAVESGYLSLKPQSEGWLVSGYDWRFSDLNGNWPQLDFAVSQQQQEWRVNVSELDIEALRPLKELVPQSREIDTWLARLEPKGTVDDLRVLVTPDNWYYSANLVQGGISQWYLLPEVHELSAKIKGNTSQARIKAEIIDDTFPYGDVFQAPLNIKHGATDLVWQKNDDGWSIWSNKVTTGTPDVQAIGAFRLDMPNQGSPFLSFYLEADLFNASQTWRYLPSLALGEKLTDYLSGAIQAGTVDTAKLLWFGELADFPYSGNEGMFQAWVGLEKGQFQFDTAWPPIEDLQLDLLFQNDDMYLSSYSAKLQQVNGTRIKGHLENISPRSRLYIAAEANGAGQAVRDYMTSTPLIDSVGAALTTIDVSGQVTSEFELDIPIDGSRARAWGQATLRDNPVSIQAPPIQLENVTGTIQFDNDVITASGMQGNLLEQPVAFDFNGSQQNEHYQVDIDVLGDWQIEPLGDYVGSKWTSRLSGSSIWDSQIGIQLNDVGFTYQIDARANLRHVDSQYPYPLNKEMGQSMHVYMQAAGNQEKLLARLQLPQARYQAEIDLLADVPVLTHTDLVVGSGSLSMTPKPGHQLDVRTEKLDLDAWLELIFEPEIPPTKLSNVTMPEIPLFETLNLKVGNLNFDQLEWNDVEFSASKQALNWQMKLDSQQAKGSASYFEPYDLAISLDYLHLYLPDDETVIPLEPEKPVERPLITDEDRHAHELIPNLTVNIQDFWLQGYKLGDANLDVERHGQTIKLKNLGFSSGSNQVAMSGDWTLTDSENRSSLNVVASGANNSDIMERFGVSSGIQKAPFRLTSSLTWQGSPWSEIVGTLNGRVDVELGKGVVTDVSGAAKLLGLFSLDSIIRKMQLDFSDVFDEGMAFDSIKGHGDIENGIFITNNIAMDGVAGDMLIRGLADLNQQTVDAEVSFTPDIGSGIPVLSAFAVAPQTALVVLAVTTVIAPVVEVFTQVNYEVVGPMDNPVVREISRSKGEFAIPETLRKKD